MFTLVARSAGQRTVDDAVRSSAKPFPHQRELTIGPVHDHLEREADARAARVMRMPEGVPPSRLVSPAGMDSASSLQRKCACGGKCSECQEDPDKPEELRMKTTRPGAVTGMPVPPSVHWALRSSGQPFDKSTRTFFERRFGHDFSHIRVHVDESAANSACEINAQAYTVGNHVVFAQGRYAPGTDEGRRLIAHELAHVAQQAGGDVAVQRFTECNAPGLTTECPQRDPGEERKSRLEPMLGFYVTDPEPGYLIRSFDIGESRLKPSLMRDPGRPKMIATITEPGSTWEVIGLSDCEGPPELNRALRQQRADAVRADLASVTGTHIVAANGAPLDDCMTPNQNQTARSWNRSVLIRRVNRQIEFEPEVIEGKRPVPKPKKQSTSDCTDKQKAEIAAAQPIAVDMVRNALYRISQWNGDPGLRALLRQHFHDDSRSTVSKVHDGLVNTLKGLQSDPTFECEEKGSLFYDYFCGGRTLAYARHWVVGLNVHLCELAFGRTDLKLAETLVHEVNHLWNHTKDPSYCFESTYPGLSTDTALNNADSFACFARDAYLIPPL
jgi:Domain of unknown function (DUF4157)/Lysine-specific metallo-endopeptidase